MQRALFPFSTRLATTPPRRTPCDVARPRERETHTRSNARVSPRRPAQPPSVRYLRSVTRRTCVQVSQETWIRDRRFLTRLGRTGPLTFRRRAQARPSRTGDMAVLTEVVSSFRGITLTSQVRVGVDAWRVAITRGVLASRRPGVCVGLLFCDSSGRHSCPLFIFPYL